MGVGLVPAVVVLCLIMVNPGIAIPLKVPGFALVRRGPGQERAQGEWLSSSPREVGIVTVVGNGRGADEAIFEVTAVACRLCAPHMRDAVMRMRGAIL